MPLIDKSIKYLSAFTASMVGVLVLLVLYDAINRYLLSGGSIALQELEWHIFDIIILFGIAYTLREDAHVRVDIFYASYTQKTKKLLSIITSVFFILPFSLLIIYIGIDFVAMSFAQNEASSNPGGLEYRFIVKSLMPLAFAFLALQAFRDAFVSFKEWRAL
jgi:TRAP-type mannitol/chloroaromatic compound transport system permease small subunit